MAGAINGTVVVVNNATGVVVGQGDFTHTYDGKLIEVTTKDSGDGTDYMEGENSGKQHIFSGEFIYNGETQFRNTRADVFSVTARQYTLVYVSDSEIDESFTGDFFPTDLNDIVPQGGAMKTTIAFKSNSIVSRGEECLFYDPQDYVARWELESTANDSSYNAHNGTIVSAPTFGTGQIGNALTFDGVDDYISIPDHADFRNLTGFSYTGWVKTLATGKIIIENFDAGSIKSGVRVAVSASGFIYVAIADGTGSSWTLDVTSAIGTTDITDGLWHHFCCTVEPSAISVFVDGALETVQDPPQNDNGDPLILAYDLTTNDLAIGAGLYPLGQFFDGSIDDIRFYERVLSLTEIEGIYASANVAPPVDFIAEWKMDSDVLDTTGNHNATAVGAPTYATGKEGNALVLNGTTQYATVVDNAALKPTNLTISTWVKIGATASAEHFFTNCLASGNYYGFRAYVASGVAALLVMRGTGTVSGTDFDTVATSTNVEDNLWHHVAFTFDGVDIKAYADGVLENTTPWAFPIDYTGCDSATIGARTQNAGVSYSNYFNGSIDKLQLFNRAVTQAEVTAMYATTLAACR